MLFLIFESGEIENRHLCSDWNSGPPNYNCSALTTLPASLLSHSVYRARHIFFNRAIFVWPWNENARTKQKQLTNGNRAIWLVNRTDATENFLEINRHFALTSCLLHIRVYFGGKTRKQEAMFDLFIHWLIKQITNTHRNHFSRSYENRSIHFFVILYSSFYRWSNREERRSVGCC